MDIYSIGNATIPAGHVYGLGDSISTAISNATITAGHVSKSQLKVLVLPLLILPLSQGLPLLPLKAQFGLSMIKGGVKIRLQCYNKHNAVALLHFDTSITKDECGNTWAAVGSPTLSSTYHKFATKSIFVNDTNYIQSTDTFTIVGMDFTIEAWIYNLDGNMTLFSLGQNISCQVLISHADRKTLLKIIGRESDRKIVLETINMLVSVCRNGIKNEKIRAKKQFGEIAGVEIAYAAGFVQAVREEMSKQCKALMLIIPNEVNEHIKQKYPNIVKRTSRNTIRFRNKDNITTARQNGYNDYKNLVCQKQIHS